MPGPGWTRPEVAQAEHKENGLRAPSAGTDPELDEPITDLGFVKELTVSDDGRVSLDLVTSTFWCSPNFVYMMMEEARDVVSRLAGINEVRVHLDGHHDSERINKAINSGTSFADCYGAEADRKSTRLNSSHLVISYAVFCLKKKKSI